MAGPEPEAAGKKVVSNNPGGNPETGERLPAGLGETAAEQRNGSFVGSIDQGTTSSRFIIFDGAGEPVAGHQIEFENHYPESG
jgi:glycerol kinase